MLCPVAESGIQTELQLHSQSSSHHAIDAAMHLSIPHEHGVGHHHDGSSGASDKCNLCSALGSVTPLSAYSSPLTLPHDATATLFADVSSFVPTFIADQLGRPPRTI